MGRNEAQEGCNRFEAVFKSKLLEIHPTKSCFLVFSPNKKIGESMGQEVMERPLVYDNFEMKRKSEEKWLGDILCERGLAESAEATITSRYGKILTSIFELKSVMEDLRMQIIGGLKCGLDIWELAMVPSLMNNCGTWMEISEKSIEKLDQLQNIFLQCMFSVSQSVPKPALCWDTATLTMQVRVDKAKLSLLHHIKHLENTSLAKQVYNEQHERGWPGLVAECKEIAKQWKIPDITESRHELSKCEWKNILKSEAKAQNCQILQEKILKSSKLEVMKNETYGEKSYVTEMKMHDARMQFSLRSRMLKCKMNYLNDPKFKSEQWRCDDCMSCVDSQSHILYCPAYQYLREGKSLKSDQDIVDYFRQVMKLRLKDDE